MNSQTAIRWKVSTAPTLEPVNVEEVKNHLRITADDDDGYLQSLIVAARRLIESYIRSVLFTQTLEGYAHRFPSARYWEVIPGPVQSITEIASYNQADSKTVFSSANYSLDSFSFPPRVALAMTASWPADCRDQNAAYIKWVAGYGVASTIPEPISRALNMLVAHWYENRLLGSFAYEMGGLAEHVQDSLRPLLRPYKVHLV